MTRLIVCNECHEMKDHYAKGMCKRCYAKIRCNKYKKNKQKYDKKYNEDKWGKKKYQQIARILNKRMKKMPFNQPASWIERKCRVCRKTINPKSDTVGYYTSTGLKRTCTPCRKSLPIPPNKGKKPLKTKDI